MYKISINETPLYLVHASDPLANSETTSERVLIAPYAGKAKFLLNYIDMLEKGKRFDAVVLCASDLEQLQRDFFGHYHLLEAAGGLVLTPSGKALFIHRLGHWDLPKGKMEAGESREETALREVMEETGLEQLQMGEPLPTTYHTYKHPVTGKRTLKATYWFLMYSEEAPLTPQTEEDILEAVWEHPQRILDDRAIPTYSNIRELLIQRYM